jgi:hypothetical protein
MQKHYEAPATMGKKDCQGHLVIEHVETVLVNPSIPTSRKN